MHSHRLRITLANRIFALFSKNIFLYFFALQKTYLTNIIQLAIFAFKLFRLNRDIQLMGWLRLSSIDHI